MRSQASRVRLDSRPERDRMTSLSVETHYICIVTTRSDDTLIRTRVRATYESRRKDDVTRDTSMQILAKGTYVEIRQALLCSLQHQQKKQKGRYSLCMYSSSG